MADYRHENSILNVSSEGNIFVRLPTYFRLFRPCRISDMNDFYGIFIPPDFHLAKLNETSKVTLLFNSEVIRAKMLVSGRDFVVLRPTQSA